MAVPKRKVSKSRRDKRRSAVWKLEAPALSRWRRGHSQRSLIFFKIQRRSLSFSVFLKDR